MKMLLMKMLRDGCGSVMMEFIIVMPIYLVLFGGTCAIGDILVHSGRLLSADRFSAFFADEKPSGQIARWIEDSMFANEVAADGSKLNSIRAVPEWHYADTTAPWSVCAAASTADAFGLSAGGGIAQVLFGKQFFRKGAGRGDNSGFWDDFEAAGRKVLFSRPGVGVGDYSHSYYVLKRKRGLGNTWREAPESLLMARRSTDHGKCAWEDEVYNEGWFDDPRKIGDHGPTQARSRPFPNANAYWYSRYDTFKRWSTL